MSWRPKSNAILGTLAVLLAGTAALADAPIELRDYCPPGFERVAGNVCELRTLYQNYESLRYAGVGGPRTGLPAARDGFSPQQIDLGRYLFFDPLLSRDGSVSCASCHHPDLGFSDGRPLDYLVTEPVLDVIRSRRLYGATP